VKIKGAGVFLGLRKETSRVSEDQHKKENRGERGLQLNSGVASESLTGKSV